MQTFPRELTQTHCVGAEWPLFVGRAGVGESFVVETVETLANGPIEIEGIKAGDDVAIHIERIEVEGTRFGVPTGGPLISGAPVEVTYRDGWFLWDERFRLKAKPSVGNVAVLPEPTDEILAMSREIVVPWGVIPNERGWRRVVRDARGKHCHQDCQHVQAGSIVHMKAQVDGAGLCLEDVHGYIGQGEMAFAAIETQARVQVRVERSVGWHVDWPLIETEDEIMVFSSFSDAWATRPPLRYVDVVRQAYRSLVEVVAARANCSFEEGNSLVATAVDVRNCALYGLKGFISDEQSPKEWDVAVVAALPKHVFVD